MGGYTIGLLLVINLLASHATRFRLKRSYIGIFLIHFGLVLLIIGAGLTSFFGHEMQMSISEGTSKNYLEFRVNLKLLLLMPVILTMIDFLASNWMHCARGFSLWVFS